MADFALGASQPLTAVTVRPCAIARAFAASAAIAAWTFTKSTAESRVSICPPPRRCAPSERAVKVQLGVPIPKPELTMAFRVGCVLKDALLARLSRPPKRSG